METVKLDITRAAWIEIAQAAGAGSLRVAQAVGIRVQVTATVGVYV